MLDELVDPPERGHALQVPDEILEQLDDPAEMTQDERHRLARVVVRDMMEDLVGYGFDKRGIRKLLRTIAGPGTIADEDTLIGSTWRTVDLSDAINGVEPEPPRLLERTDKVRLLYPGRVHWFQGEPESLKSWAAQLAVVQAINDGHKVLYIDFEDEARGVVSRLLALGADRDCVEWNFAYVRPTEPLMSDARRHVYGGGWLNFTEALDVAGKGFRIDLVVIDGVTEAMAMEGLDPMSNSDIAVWMRLLPRYIADHSDHPAVVVIDHVTKSKEGRGRWAIGGQHKLAGVDGAVYAFEVTRPLHRALVEPVEGRATITVHKDRPGHVRTSARDGVVGTLELVAYPDGGVTGRIAAPDAINTAPPAHLRAAILGHLDVYDGAAKSAIETAVGGNAMTIRHALRWLVDNNHIEVRREGVAHRHYLTQLGRDALAELTEDDQ